MSMWTDEQREAIERDGDNILVSAAAGSGKTAVLVERLIRKITDPKQRIDVDQLLVATFTKAAAAEMKQRIRNALEEALKKDGQSEHLRRQLSLIHRAPITTIHSFCLEVVQEHVHELGIDPSFRVANEVEVEMIRQDVLEQVFEHYYESSPSDSPFWKLVDAYGGDRSDEALFHFILQLHTFAQSHPWPMHWLEQQAELYRAFAESHHDADQALQMWLQSLVQEVLLLLDEMASFTEEAIRLTGLPGGPTPYRDNLFADRELIVRLQQLVLGGDWDAIYMEMQVADFTRLKSCRGDQYDKPLQERVKWLRDAAKKRLTQMKENLFQRSIVEYREEIGQLAPLVDVLVEVVKQFDVQFRREKRSKALLDFSDLEHECLRVLLDPNAPPGQCQPSHHALAYRDRFAEVLLDEYQDTNRVQEMIVELISRKDPGNRFMVGDVKQSIYRFRLAEPGLFLEKYHRYAAGEDGRRIDLSRNFRSRKQVIDGVNFIFRQLMKEKVGELNYDQDAELVNGIEYPEDMPDSFSRSVELMLIDRTAQSEEMESSIDGEPSEFEHDEIELETVQLESRMIAQRIKELMGAGGQTPFHVYDTKSKTMRPLAYRDIVILIRATRDWAPVMLEELNKQGIPCYAELSEGYFSAGEVEVVLSLLKVIDNPYQDIPLVAVLRSPIVQLTAEQLAQIRLIDKQSAFYDAVLRYAAMEAGVEAGLQYKLQSFLQLLEKWRSLARQGSLSGLIWQIYRETGYYEIVGGLPGGAGRQANLRALIDRARQYEETSFRGLFRFLRFIERMRESGADLGSARAIGEQEDVVRIMSIHKSKGLEFPVVFVAGTAKLFNRQDLNRSFLLHKDLGLGPKIVDTEKRIIYPSLPHLSIRRKLKLELLAEEMRVLYVALTRAKEKLMLVGTVKNLAKQTEHWVTLLAGSEHKELPDHLVAAANSYMDWIGPAILRHPHAASLLNDFMHTNDDPDENVPNHTLITIDDPSVWNVYQTSTQADIFAEVAVSSSRPQNEQLDALKQVAPLPGYERSVYADQVAARLDWTYPYEQDARTFSKTSVSEWKRMMQMKQLNMMDDERAYSIFEEPALYRKSLLRRPKFMEKAKISAVERGTLYHVVMQHFPFDRGHTKSSVEEELDRMVFTGLLTDEQRSLIDGEVIYAFFQSELGTRLLKAENVYREAPFSFGIPAHEFDSQRSDTNATMLIQGVIDCLFEEENGFVLIDYKTDAVYPGRLEVIKERYTLQMDLYARAVEQIWKKPVHEKVLFLFDGAHIVSM